MRSERLFRKRGFMPVIYLHWKYMFLVFLTIMAITNIPVLLPTYNIYSLDHENLWTTLTGASIPTASNVLWLTYGYCIYWSLAIQLMLIISFLGMNHTRAACHLLVVVVVVVD
jgi:hypothetical protein